MRIPAMAICLSFMAGAIFPGWAMAMEAAAAQEGQSLLAQKEWKTCEALFKATRKPACPTPSASTKETKTFEEYALCLRIIGRAEEGLRMLDDCQKFLPSFSCALSYMWDVTSLGEQTLIRIDRENKAYIYVRMCSEPPFYFSEDKKQRIRDIRSRDEENAEEKRLIDEKIAEQKRLMDKRQAEQEKRKKVSRGLIVGGSILVATAIVGFAVNAAYPTTRPIGKLGPEDCTSSLGIEKDPCTANMSDVLWPPFFGIGLAAVGAGVGVAFSK